MGEAERRRVFVCDAEGEGFGGDWGDGNGVIFDVLVMNL